MCPVFLWLLALMGCDVTSKIETKYGALNTKIKDYLKPSDQSKNFCHEEAEGSESYLVKVLRPSSACTTVNELRVLFGWKLVSDWFTANIILDIWAYPSIWSFYSSVLESSECNSEVQCSRIWLDWSWKWMFHTRQMLITNTSLLYCRTWMQKKMFPTLPVFVCRYKMNFVLCL